MNRDDELIKRGNARSQAKAACEKAIWWAINACKDDGKYKYLVDTAMDAVPAFPQEMTAREFVKARRRLCEAHLNAITQSVDDFVTRCEGCVLENYCEGSKDNVDGEVAIVEQWAKEHPEKKRKTYAEDFFSKYPDAPHSTKNGMVTDRPAACRMVIYGGGPLCITTKCDCAACWNEEMEASE